MDAFFMAVGSGFFFYLISSLVLFCFPKKLKLKPQNKILIFITAVAVLYGLNVAGNRSHLEVPTAGAIMTVLIYVLIVGHKKK